MRQALGLKMPCRKLKLVVNEFLAESRHPATVYKPIEFAVFHVPRVC